MFYVHIQSKNKKGDVVWDNYSADSNQNLRAILKAYDILGEEVLEVRANKWDSSIEENNMR